MAVTLSIRTSDHKVTVTAQGDSFLLGHRQPCQHRNLARRVARSWAGRERLPAAGIVLVHQTAFEMEEFGRFDSMPSFRGVSRSCAIDPCSVLTLCLLQ
jgi:hypothetical protein